MKPYGRSMLAGGLCLCFFTWMCPAGRSQTAELHVNCGAVHPALDEANRMWVPDTPFLQGGQAPQPGHQTDDYVDSLLLSDFYTPQQMLRTSRWRDGDLVYAVPLPAGEYEVTLYFSENRPGEVSSDLGGSGCAECTRLFDVEVGGHLVAGYNPADAVMPPGNDGMGFCYMATELQATCTVVDTPLHIAIRDTGTGNPPGDASINGFSISGSPAPWTAPPHVVGYLTKFDEGSGLIYRAMPDHITVISRARGVDGPWEVIQADLGGPLCNAYFDPIPGSQHEQVIYRIEDLGPRAFSSVPWYDPQEIRAAAYAIQSAATITSGSEVYFCGPVDPGMEMYEGTGGEVPVLVVPHTAGTYYSGYIDDDPGALFDHPVRYIWVDLNTGSNQVAPAVQPPRNSILSVSNWPARVWTVDAAGVPYLFDGSLAYPPAEADIEHKQEVAAPPVPPPHECKKVALVIDGGDANGWLSCAASVAKDADTTAAWLESRGFEVQRISQYWGNGHAALARDPENPCSMKDQLVDLFDDYVQSLSCPDCTGPCHEFFFFVEGHGNEDGFSLRDPSGSGDKCTFSWDLLRTQLSRFDDNVKLSVFANSCSCGALITGGGDMPMEDLHPTRPNGLTVITGGDDSSTLPSGLWFLPEDSAPQDFHEGAGQDYDQDGDTGDFFDRWYQMATESGNAAPQVFHYHYDGANHKFEQTGDFEYPTNHGDDWWCSLD